MARKIMTPQSNAAPAAAAPELPAGSAVFVKNQLEKIRFPDGTSHTFIGGRTIIEDPQLIEKLREAAAKPGNPHGIFEVAT